MYTLVHMNVYIHILMRYTHTHTNAHTHTHTYTHTRTHAYNYIQLYTYTYKSIRTEYFKQDSFLKHVELLELAQKKFSDKYSENCTLRMHIVSLARRPS